MKKKLSILALMLCAAIAQATANKPAGGTQKTEDCWFDKTDNSICCADCQGMD
jgi:uncharacterized lipoprotein NlpE involved in copper resistance